MTGVSSVANFVAVPKFVLGLLSDTYASAVGVNVALVAVGVGVGVGVAVGVLFPRAAASPIVSGANASRVTALPSAPGVPARSPSENAASATAGMTRKVMNAAARAVRRWLR